MAIERKSKCQNASTITAERWSVVHSYTLVRSLPNRDAAPVSAAILEMLRPYKVQCLTLTFDNGKEFAGHAFFGS